MKALRLHGHRDLRLDEVDEPKILPGWSIVEVDWASICASDVKEYLGPLTISEIPNPITGVSIPVTLGHEFAGRVLKTDGSRSDIGIGDRVAVEGTITDGTCWQCQHGNYVLCDRLAILGFDAHGGFAERVVVPNHGLYKLPDSLSPEAGAIVEPLAVGIHAIRRGSLALGDSVAVVGTGMIGLGIVALARVSGASTVFAVEPMPGRRERARTQGAFVTDDAASAPAQVQELTSGRGADVTFDCVGNQDSLKTAIGLTRKGGRVVVVGVFKTPPIVEMNMIVLHERELIGCLGPVDSFPHAISLLADGRIDAEIFISKRVPFRDVIAEGFEKLIDEPDRHVRIVADIHQT